MIKVRIEDLIITDSTNIYIVDRINQQSYRLYINKDSKLVIDESPIDLIDNKLEPSIILDYNAHEILQSIVNACASFGIRSDREYKDKIIAETSSDFYKEQMEIYRDKYSNIVESLLDNLTKRTNYDLKESNREI